MMPSGAAFRMARWSLLMSPRFLLLVLTACAAEGHASTPEIKKLVTLEIVDAERGRPIPCRVSIRGDDGTWHFPQATAPGASTVAYRKKAIGHLDIVEIHTTRSAHPFSVRLPEGRYTLKIDPNHLIVPRNTVDVPGKPLCPRKFEVDYLIQRVEAQMARSSGVLPTPLSTSIAPR
jgi:hypothetical protein